MMCASTVQVAALPGEVVSNTGNQVIVKEQKVAPDLEPMRALLTVGSGLLFSLIVEIWELNILVPIFLLSKAI